MVREPQDTRCDYPADHDGKCSGVPDVSFGSTTPWCQSSPEAHTGNSVYAEVNCKDVQEGPGDPPSSCTHKENKWVYQISFLSISVYLQIIDNYVTDWLTAYCSSQYTGLLLSSSSQLWGEGGCGKILNSCVLISDMLIKPAHIRHFLTKAQGEIPAALRKYLGSGLFFCREAQQAVTHSLVDNIPLLYSHPRKNSSQG